MMLFVTRFVRTALLGTWACAVAAKDGAKDSNRRCSAEAVSVDVTSDEGTSVEHSACLLQLGRTNQMHVKRQADEEEISVIPAPSMVTRTPGSLLLGLGSKPQLSVEAASEMARKAFKDHVLSMMEGATASVAVAGQEPIVQLRLGNQSESFADEGYRLKVTADKVEINAATEHGLFNGLMTLRQLLRNNTSGQWSVPLVEISDTPAFTWRGLMLDVSRHFFSAEDVKHLLKTMALFKLNHFHWHLTDDQGWRFPVEKYPKLISLGAARRATQQGHVATLDDGMPYNHSYTVEEIEDIVSLAESLHIEVMPEFDMPGHSEAAIAAYPEFGNKDSASVWEPEVGTKFGAMQYTLSPTEVSVNFTKDVLSELSLLFPSSSYVHIGGDEVPTDQWVKSPLAVEVAKQEGLAVSQLEGYMLTHAAEHLKGLKRHAVVWDEALESGASLPEGSVAMLWRSWESMTTLGDRAKAKGLSVVLTPQDHTYLDQWQADGGIGEKFDAIGGYLPLSKVYESPLSAGGAHVLGLQGQLWSEYIAQGQPNLDYMAWPRGCALAEAAWSGSARPGFGDFERRLARRTSDFEQFDVKFRKLDNVF